MIIQINDLPGFKRKALKWASTFNAVCYLDSNGFNDPYSKFDTLIAIGAKNEITASTGNAFSSLQQFRNAYEKVNPKPKTYIVDLQESDYLDSSALGMLLALRDHAGGDSANIRITHSNPDIKKILVITKLDELFKVE